MDWHSTLSPQALPARRSAQHGVVALVVVLCWQLEWCDVALV
jgi:hypothetical protein